MKKVIFVKYTEISWVSNAKSNAIYPEWPL